jgi:hypothetical protein
MQAPAVAAWATGNTVVTCAAQPQQHHAARALASCGGNSGSELLRSDLNFKEPHGCIDRSAHALSSTRGEQEWERARRGQTGWESGVRLFGGECKRPEGAIARRSELGGVAVQEVRGL